MAKGQKLKREVEQLNLVLAAAQERERYLREELAEEIAKRLNVEDKVTKLEKDQQAIFVAIRRADQLRAEVERKNQDLEELLEVVKGDRQAFFDMAILASSTIERAFEFQTRRLDRNAVEARMKQAAAQGGAWGLGAGAAQVGSSPVQTSGNLALAKR